jgi:hypothetical protein
MRPLGAMLGAIGANDFLRPANESGRADCDHARSWTDPDDAERLTGIYGSDALRSLCTPNLRSLAASL